MTRPDNYILAQPTACVTAERAGAVIVALAMGACCSSPASRAGAGITVQRIVVLGDSLLVSPAVAKSFPSLLQQRLTERGSPATVINAGVHSDTTAWGVARIDAVLAQKPTVLILARGANDGLRGVQVEALSRNLGAMIQRSKQQGVQVLLCGMELPPLRGMSYARSGQRSRTSHAPMTSRSFRSCSTAWRSMHR